MRRSRSIGLHKVPVALHPEVEVTVTVNVARNADEAERQARGENVTVRREETDEERCCRGGGSVLREPEDAEAIRATATTKRPTETSSGGGPAGIGGNRDVEHDRRRLGWHGVPARRVTGGGSVRRCLLDRGGGRRLRLFDGCRPAPQAAAQAPWSCVACHAGLPCCSISRMFRRRLRGELLALFAFGVCRGGFCGGGVFLGGRRAAGRDQIGRHRRAHLRPRGVVLAQEARDLAALASPCGPLWQAEQFDAKVRAASRGSPKTVCARSWTTPRPPASNAPAKRIRITPDTCPSPISADDRHLPHSLTKGSKIAVPPNTAPLPSYRNFG